VRTGEAKHNTTGLASPPRWLRGTRSVCGSSFSVMPAAFMSAWRQENKKRARVVSERHQ
jgi:hypothetical protein